MHFVRLLTPGLLNRICTLVIGAFMALNSFADPSKEFQPANTMTGFSDNAEIILNISQFYSGSCEHWCRTPKFHLLFEVYRGSSRHLVSVEKTEILTVSLGSVPTNSKLPLNQQIRLNVDEINNAFSKLPDPIIYNPLGQTGIEKEVRILKVSLYHTGIVLNDFLKEFVFYFPGEASKDQLLGDLFLNPKRPIKTKIKGLQDTEITLSIWVEDSGENIKAE